MRNLKTLLVGLGAIFNKKITPDMLAGYEMALDEYNEADLVRVGQKLAQGKYFPRPYDFIQEIEGNEPDIEDLASLRWEQILAYIWKDQPFPDDPIASYVYKSMGDTFYFRQMTENRIHGAGFAFRRSYCATAAIEEVREKNLIAAEPLKAQIGSVIKKLTMD